MSDKLEDELASELQAATGESLDFGHVRRAGSSASPGRPRNSIELPRPAYSPNAKLELLHSPTEVRPAEWLSPQSPSKQQPVQQPIQLLYEDGLTRPHHPTDDEDDMLPSRGLSGRIESVKAGRSHLSPALITDLDLHSDSSHVVNAAPGSPTKLRIATPVNDIYINQYGERVVNGKVVGKTIGGRPRQATDARPPSVLERASKISPVFAETPRFENGKSPPAFFLESFPTTSSPNQVSVSLHTDSVADLPLQAPRAVSRPLLLAPPDDVDEPFNDAVDRVKSATDAFSISDDGDDVLSRPDTAEEALKNFTDVSLHTPVDEFPLKAKLPTTRDALGLSLRPPSTTCQVNREETEHVVLHGNKRQARASGGSESVATGSVNERSASPFLLPILSKRVERLFTAPRVAPASSDTHVDNLDTRGEGAEPVHTSEAHEPEAPALGHADTPAKANSDEDAASLYSASSSLLSLPVSVPSHASGTSSLERRRSGDTGKPRRRSRRSDQSLYADDNFARDVRIRGWNEVGSQARGWVVFEILIVTKQGTPITILKRFSSFVTLRKQLVTECPNQSKWLPALPSKSTGILRKYDAKHLEKRRKDLQQWLEVVMLDKVWGCSESLRSWVLSSE